jgi:hypothetical protein
LVKEIIFSGVMAEENAGETGPKDKVVSVKILNATSSPDISAKLLWPSI